jgi:hypothetical protein
MSQNNYIDFLRDSTILKEQNKLPSILNTSEYTRFKGYSVEKNIVNTKTCYSELLPNGNQNIFDMKRKIDNCPNIQMCLNTNARPNRILRSEQYPAPTVRFNKNPVEKTCECNGNRICTRVWRYSKCKTRACDCNPPVIL